MVSMPNVTAVIREQETSAVFEARITLAAIQLHGNYSMSEHRVCSTQLRHYCLNHVFTLAGVNCQPCPDSIARGVKK
jgi:hypothetical protein